MPVPLQPLQTPTPDQHLLTSGVEVTQMKPAELTLDPTDPAIEQTAEQAHDAETVRAQRLAAEAFLRKPAVRKGLLSV